MPPVTRLLLCKQTFNGADKERFLLAEHVREAPDTSAPLQTGKYSKQARIGFLSMAIIQSDSSELDELEDQSSMEENESVHVVLW